jgi:hypothetical protein
MMRLDDEPNAGKAWSDRELELLKRLANDHVPTRAIAERLGRSEYSVRSKASQCQISLLGARASIASRKLL